MWIFARIPYNKEKITLQYHIPMTQVSWRYIQQRVDLGLSLGVGRLLRRIYLYLYSKTDEFRLIRIPVQPQFVDSRGTDDGHDDDKREAPNLKKVEAAGRLSLLPWAQKPPNQVCFARTKIDGWLCRREC